MDAEIETPLEPELWDLVLCPEERAALRAFGPSRSGVLGKLALCAKESFYKLQFPMTRCFLGFTEARVEIQPEPRTFSVTLLRNAGPFAAGETWARALSVQRWSHRQCHDQASVMLAIERGRRLAGGNVLVHKGANPSILVIAFNSGFQFLGMRSNEFELSSVTDAMGCSRIHCKDPQFVWYHAGLDPDHPDIRSSLQLLKELVVTG